MDRTIARRLIRTLHLVEKSIPRFTIGHLGVASELIVDGQRFADLPIGSADWTLQFRRYSADFIITTSRSAFSVTLHQQGLVQRGPARGSTYLLARSLRRLPPMPSTMFEDAARPLNASSRGNLATIVRSRSNRFLPCKSPARPTHS